MPRSRTRVPRRPVHGVLLLDKPLGLSSNDALQRVKWLLRAEKAGHTGTLDPLASGVLPVCFGAATKFSQLHLDADKTYHARLRFGVQTTTGDAEGEVVRVQPIVHDADDIRRVLAQFTGPILQVPPMHSALKHDGRALYEYAREGVAVEREARPVTIFELEWLDAGANQGSDAIEIRVKCSKGTYIRTLAEDIGEALGCGAHLTALRRVATGPFALDAALTLQQIEACAEGERLGLLRPVEDLLSGCPPVVLSSEDAGRFLSGMRRRGAWPDAPLVAVYGIQPRALLGTGEVRGGELIPRRLLSPVEIEQILEILETPAGD